MTDLERMELVLRRARSRELNSEDRNRAAIIVEAFDLVISELEAMNTLIRKGD